MIDFSCASKQQLLRTYIQFWLEGKWLDSLQNYQFSSSAVLKSPIILHYSIHTRLICIFSVVQCAFWLTHLLFCLSFLDHSWSFHSKKTIKKRIWHWTVELLSVVFHILLCNLDCISCFCRSFDGIEIMDSYVDGGSLHLFDGQSNCQLVTYVPTSRTIWTVISPWTFDTFKWSLL